MTASDGAGHPLGLACPATMSAAADEAMDKPGATLVSAPPAVPCNVPQPGCLGPGRQRVAGQAATEASSGAQTETTVGCTSSEDDADGPATLVDCQETISIFDWDDTVLPSTWVQEHGLRLDEASQLSAQQREELGTVSRNAAKMLHVAKQLGTVVLVTNAERGWIELSCQKFLPTLYPSLESVKLLSARSEYERPDLQSPLEWKLKAFESEISRVFRENRSGRKNILSVGDCCYEREAVIHATAQLPNCLTKSLKFVERPRIDQLCREHVLVASIFKDVIKHDGNLDLSIRAM